MKLKLATCTLATCALVLLVAASLSLASYAPVTTIPLPLSNAARSSSPGLLVSLSAATSPSPTPAPIPWWTWPCNTPSEGFVDGCGEFTRIERPDASLSSPCVCVAYIEEIPNDDEPAALDTHLVILVNHPEYDDGQMQQVRVIRPAGTDIWETDYGDWSYKCGRDEAPLAWAVTEMLNTRAPVTIYNQPLPTPLLALIAYAAETPALAAADAKHRLYLPLAMKNN